MKSFIVFFLLINGLAVGAGYLFSDTIGRLVLWSRGYWLLAGVPAAVALFVLFIIGRLFSDSYWQTRYYPHFTDGVSNILIFLFFSAWCYAWAAGNALFFNQYHRVQYFPNPQALWEKGAETDLLVLRSYQLRSDAALYSVSQSKSSKTQNHTSYLYYCVPVTDKQGQVFPLYILDYKTLENTKLEDSRNTPPDSMASLKKEWAQMPKTQHSFAVARPGFMKHFDAPAKVLQAQVPTESLILLPTERDVVAWQKQSKYILLFWLLLTQLLIGVARPQTEEE